MNLLYLDIFSGISGDMFVGALIDLGVNFKALEQDLAKLGLDGYHLHASRQERAHISGTKFDVHLTEMRSAECGVRNEGHHHSHALAHDLAHDLALDQKHEHEHEHEHEHGHEHEHQHAHDHDLAHAPDHRHEHEHEREHEHEQDQDQEQDHLHEHEHGRTFAQIRQLIAGSPYSAWVKTRAESVFRRIAEAEGKIHGCPPDAVHFHEVGAIDSIIDVVGGCLALEMLGRPRVLAQTVVEGRGWIDCAHGRFPLPAPATLAILGARGIAVTQCDEPHELVTPTGAALLAEFAESFGPMRGLVAAKIGYGLGTRNHQTRPNALRAVLGPEPGNDLDWETDQVAVLETNLDDLPAEILGHFTDIALAAGALDVFHTPIQMKKNRPGVLLSVLCPVERADAFTELILRETSAFGVRRTWAERRKLRREFKTVETPYGPVTVKLGWLQGQILHATPEFESCKKLAAQAGVALQKVYDAVPHCLKP